MLLSSLRGSAVWAFRLDGVVHEHQTVPGVLEDVHQIIQRLKALTLVLAEDVDEAVLRIKPRGAPARSTPATSSRTASVRVVNPDHLLFTLQDDREITGELYVNKGRGYVEGELHQIDRSLPVDLVRIDAIYNPVRRANFTVAETRVGQRTDYDRLTVVGRDQRHPDAGRRASPTRRRWPRNTSATSWSSARSRWPGPRRGAPAPAMAAHLRERLARPIDDFGLSVRSLNSLKNSNIRTLGDLVQLHRRRSAQGQERGREGAERDRRAAAAAKA